MEPCLDRYIYWIPVWLFGELWGQRQPRIAISIVRRFIPYVPKYVTHDSTRCIDLDDQKTKEPLSQNGLDLRLWTALLTRTRRDNEEI